MLDNRTNTLAEAWGIFHSQVIPKDVPLVQVEEMEKAFYAGAVSLLSLQTINGSRSEEVLVNMMEAWYGECLSFYSGLLRTQNNESR